MVHHCTDARACAQVPRKLTLRSGGAEAAPGMPCSLRDGKCLTERKPTHMEEYGNTLILSVDDEPTNHLVIEEALESAGYKVGCCCSSHLPSSTVLQKPQLENDPAVCGLYGGRCWGQHAHKSCFALHSCCEQATLQSGRCKDLLCRLLQLAQPPVNDCGSHRAQASCALPQASVCL